MSAPDSRPRRALAAAVALLLCCGAALPTSYAATANACGGAVDDGPIELGSVPVLFVHGIISGPDMWHQSASDDSDSLFTRITEIPGAQPFTFSYRDAALNWVTDDRIAPALAEAVTCLAEASQRQVVVVAHSMGGLATQLALATRGGAVGDAIAEVVTIGTPFEGSVFLKVAQAAIAGTDIIAAANGNPALAAGMEIVLALCARAGKERLARGEDNPCGLAAVPRSPVGVALIHKSPRIAALPDWPSDDPRLQSHAGDIGTDISITVGGFGPTPETTVKFGRVALGDIPVSLDSATAEGERGEVIECPVGDLGRAELTADFELVLDSPCWHLNLHRNPKIINSVLNTVRASVTAQTPTPVEDVDWYNREYEIACAEIADGPFLTEVSNGSGTGAGDSQSGGYVVRVIDVVTGDLTRDGATEAAVLLLCAPELGGPNFFTNEVQVFTSGEEQLATLNPPGPPSDFNFSPQFIGEPFTISDGILDTGANYWVGQDANCCPSIQRQISWSWADDHFEPQ